MPCYCAFTLWSKQPSIYQTCPKPMLSTWKSNSALEITNSNSKCFTQFSSVVLQCSRFVKQYLNICMCRWARSNFSQVTRLVYGVCPNARQLCFHSLVNACMYAHIRNMATATQHTDLPENLDLHLKFQLLIPSVARNFQVWWCSARGCADMNINILMWTRARPVPAWTFFRAAAHLEAKNI